MLKTFMSQAVQEYQNSFEYRLFREKIEINSRPHGIHELTNATTNTQVIEALAKIIFNLQNYINLQLWIITF